MLRRHVVTAVLKRNVASYFSGVLGYLFIIVFVLAGSFFAFQPAFFAANQANLDQLTLRYSWLLVFIIPAITMAVWADERKLGTDELLFTLPASGRADVPRTVHPIGRIEARREVVLTGDDGVRRPLPDLGWDHLA